MRELDKNFIPFLIFLLAIFLFLSLFNPFSREREIPLSEVVSQINKGEIKGMIVAGDEISLVYQDGKKAKSRKEGENFCQLLLTLGTDPERLREVEIEFREKREFFAWLGPLFLSLLPFFLMFLFLLMIFRQAKIGTTQTFDFTKARARLFGVSGQPREKVTFKDVAGLKEAKEELKEVVDFLKNPKKYLRMGAKIPRGVLLIGAPGTGKTMLAKAVANESGVSFFSISGSEFIELFVGVGSSRVRSLFEQARKVGRAIVFIDEIDSIGKIRGVGITGGHEEREQTLNQLLAEMDGIGREENLVVMGATNKPEYLDPALLRPGRFDRRIVLDLPDVNDREETLRIHCRGKPLSLNVNLREVAERTAGFSGADLANVVNEAAILAARRNKTEIFQEEFLESIEKVLLGPERKSHILSKKEKEIAAYHEAGHALVSASLPEAEPVRKISIVARGLAAGYTLKMPVEERKIKTKTEFLAEMTTLLGGYCAEKLKFNEITTGAANDLERASQLARKLVKEYGMSSLGPISFGERERLIFLGAETEQKNYSEEVAKKIDKEVERFLKNAEKKAGKILIKKKSLLEEIAKTLIERETIEREQFEKLIKWKRRSSPIEKTSDKTKRSINPIRKNFSNGVKVKIRRV